MHCSLLIRNQFMMIDAEEEQPGEAKLFGALHRFECSCLYGSCRQESDLFRWTRVHDYMQEVCCIPYR